MPDAWTLVKFLFPLWLSAGRGSEGQTADASRRVKGKIFGCNSCKSRQLVFIDKDSSGPP